MEVAIRLKMFRTMFFFPSQPLLVSWAAVCGVIMYQAQVQIKSYLDC